MQTHCNLRIAPFIFAPLTLPSVAVAMSHVYIASVLVFLVVLLNTKMAIYPEENIT